MKHDDTERFDLTPQQAAEYLGVNVATIKRWASKGKLVGWKTPGGHWKFRRSDLDALLPEPAESVA